MGALSSPALRPSAQVTGVLTAYRLALAKSSDGAIFKASAIRSRLSAVTLRSPRSIFPVWLRSIPEICASASCETFCALRTSLIAQPKAFRRRSSSADRGILATTAPFQKVHIQATGYTTHFLIDIYSIITHVILTRGRECYFPEVY
jgi:hypothetical protein